MNLTLSVLAALLLASRFAATAAPVFALAKDGRALADIVITEKAIPATRTNANELASHLGRMSGASFKVVTAASLPTTPAIVVGTLEDFPQARGALPPGAEKLFAESREAFALKSEGNRLLVIGAAEPAVPHAVFTLLEQLGCRWFMPGDNWTIIPSRRELNVEVDVATRPAFRMRNFFGSGGFGPANPVDPKLTFRDKWEAWKRHNRFGGEFQFAGHSGEAFSEANKAALEAHPEYRAMVNGQRLPWSHGVKPCASNPAAVKLFIEDRLKAFRQQLKVDPDGPRSSAVSVEPSDGGNHCECLDCVRLGSVSDRVFFLANEVAKAVAREFPGRAVSLYAYNAHAAVPAISLEPNVYVTAIPYGFQRTGMTGDELLAAWKSNSSRLSLYDYWSIPDWENNLPTFDFAGRAAERIRYWHQQGVEGFSAESTYSAGAMGLAWYVAGRLMWNPQADEKALIADFLNQSFGSAAPPMRRMLTRWSKGFLLTDHELGLSFRDLAEARRLAGTDAAVLARLNDYAGYVHYLRLWYEYQEAKPKTAVRTAAARAVVAFAWRLYPNCMVHTFRMHQLVASRYERDEQLLADYDMKKPGALGWATATPLAAEEFAALLTDGVAKYRPYEFEAREFGQKLEPLAKPAQSPAGVRKEAAFSPRMRMAGITQFEVEAPPDLKSLTLKIQVSANPNPTAADRLRAWSADGANVFEQELPADGQEREVVVPLPKPGRYRLEIFDQKTMFTLQVPAGVPLVTRSFISPDLSPKVFFHLPKGLTRLAMHMPGVVPIKLFDGDGKPATYQGSKLIVADVPPGQDGRVWSLSGYKAWVPIKVLNAPQVFSFFPDTLMLPAPVSPSVSKP